MTQTALLLNTTKKILKETPPSEIEVDKRGIKNMMGGIKYETKQLNIGKREILPELFE